MMIIYIITLYGDYEELYIQKKLVEFVNLVKEELHTIHGMTFKNCLGEIKELSLEAIQEVYGIYMMIL